MRETTRKLTRVAAALAAVILAGTGCATRGPNHIYVTTAGDPSVHDLGPTTVRIAGVLSPGETAVGLAYDFNTDHLFVRIAPTQVIRVIERPSGKILRDMPVPLPDNLPTEKVVGTNTGPAALPRSAPKDTAPMDKPRDPSWAQQGASHGALFADLAIRSSDRHLFAVHGDGHSILELTLSGKVLRRLKLNALIGPVRGLAYDQGGDRLIILSADGGHAQIGTVTPSGDVTDYVTLAAPVRPVSLGYDSEAQRYFVPQVDGRTLGEFDRAGNLVASHPIDAGPITAVDAGPRAFVRVF